MIYDPKKHHRRSIRLKGYDYSKPGMYYVTIVTHNHKCFFGKIENGKMILNEYGEIAQQCWTEITRRFPNIEIDEYIIMPDHIHAIIKITNPPVGTTLAVVPDKTDGAVVPNKTDGAVVPNKTDGAVVPDKTDGAVVPDKTYGAVVPDKTDDAVVPDKTDGAVVPYKTDGAVVPDKTDGAVVPDKTYGAVVPDKTDGAVVPDKTDGAVVPDKIINNFGTYTDTNITDTKPPSLGDIVGAYKSIVSNKCLLVFKQKNQYMGKLWQRNYYEHIIKNNTRLSRIRKYIINNPANWNNYDEFFL